MFDVIVAVKNGDYYFYLCLMALTRQEGLEKVIVVTPKGDNAITICKLFNKYCYELITVEEPPHYCLAWARRLGANYCTAEYIIFVDSDVIMSPNRLTALTQQAQTLQAQGFTNVAVEGVLKQYLISPFYALPEIPTTKIITGRGCTHNTVFNRAVLLSWKPPFAHAWEDWHLTQHVMSLERSVWLRTAEKHLKSVHVKDYGMIKRAAWDTAGERLIKQISFTAVLKRNCILFYIGIRDSLLKHHPRYIVFYLCCILGNFQGFCRWDAHVRLNKLSSRK